MAFCAHAILDEDPLVVPDTVDDLRFSDNPLVIGDPKIRFYAGVPVATGEGLNLGTLCVIDHVPRQLSDFQLGALQTLAHQVELQFKLREKIAQLQIQENQIRNQASQWEAVARVASAVATSSDHEQVLTALRGAVEGAISLDGLALVELDGDDAIVVASWERNDGIFPKGARLEGAGRYQHLHLKQTYRIANLANSEHATERAIAAKFGTTSFVRLPLFSGGTLTGALVVMRTVEAPFSDADVALLEALAPHLAHVLLNVKSQLAARVLVELKDRLSAFLVHDLKNPLSVVSTNLEWLQENEVAPDRREAIEDSRSAVSDLLTMILDLLDTGRAEDGRLQVAPEPTQLGPFLNDIVRGHRGLLRDRVLNMTVEGAPYVLARIDPILFRRVVGNLIGNSVRFAQQSVAVGAVDRGDHLVIYVENDGPSIPAEQRSRLFQKYGQLGDATVAPQSRGLGLYFCRMVVEGHQGVISVADRVGGGARFEIRLPVAGEARTSALVR